jgi:hypothetical protein
MEELVEIALDDSGDSESELEPERRDRTFVVAAKLVLEATSHVMAPGMGILDFITGFRQLLLKQDAFELPKVGFCWKPSNLHQLHLMWIWVSDCASRNQLGCRFPGPLVACVRVRGRGVFSEPTSAFVRYSIYRICCYHPTAGVCRVH